MSTNQEVKRFIDAIMNDDTLKNELKNFDGDVPAIITYANGKGYAFNREDLDAYSKEVKGAKHDDAVKRAQVLGAITKGFITFD